MENEEGSLKEGQCYFRKKRAVATVRKVLKINDNTVEYEVLHGPVLKQQKFGKCSKRNFRRWTTGETEEKADYSMLEGCSLWKTYVVQNTQGKPIIRCSGKRAKFYLKKGYVTEVGPFVLQFTNDTTERRLNELYDNNLSEFFMEVKNDRCVCCGRPHNLTRHHVVPKRYIKEIPQPWRSSISNILFLCWPCHTRYENYMVEHGDPEIVLDFGDPFLFARSWRDHFLTIMNPKFIPKGWDIITVKNLDAIKIRESNGKRNC